MMTGVKMVYMPYRGGASGLPICSAVWSRTGLFSSPALFGSSMAITTSHRWRVRTLLEGGLEAVDRLRELLGDFAPGHDATVIAGPTQLLNFARYNARRFRAVPSPACPRIHDNRIFTRNMHDTTPYILTGVRTKPASSPAGVPGIVPVPWADGERLFQRHAPVLWISSGPIGVDRRPLRPALRGFFTFPRQRSDVGRRQPPFPPCWRDGTRPRVIVVLHKLPRGHRNLRRALSDAANDPASLARGQLGAAQTEQLFFSGSLRSGPPFRGEPLFDLPAYVGGVLCLRSADRRGLARRRIRCRPTRLNRHSWMASGYP